MNVVAGHFLLYAVIVGVCHSVKITNLRVPATYELGNSSDPQKLILDCEYELGPAETGFVLKWLFNDQSIYQWIPSHKPYALSFMKGRIDTTYTVSKDKVYKHRALLINKPLWNLTGEYTCHVQTFESSDKKSANMQIIVPESDFELNQSLDDDGMVNIRCSATDVYPEPKLTILLGDNDLDSAETTPASESTRDENGLYDATVERRLSKDDLDSPTPINCILTLPGTNYTKKCETLYYDVQSTESTEFPEYTNRSNEKSNLEIDPNDGTSAANRQILSFVVGLASGLQLILSICCVGISSTNSVRLHH